MKPSVRTNFNVALMAFVLAVVTLAGTVARADTMYSFLLTPNPGQGTGNYSGTALLTLASAIPATSSFDANQTNAVGQFTTKILALKITMSNGSVFTLASQNSQQADIFFSNDTLQNFSFFANATNPSLGIGGTHYDFSTNGNFSGSAYTGGTITFNPVPVTAATPEPSSLLLLGSGLLGISGLARRKLLGR